VARPSPPEARRWCRGWMVASGCRASCGRLLLESAWEAERVDDHVMSSDGTRLVVRRRGAGRPVVLVHPSACGLESFDPIVSRLSPSWNCGCMRVVATPRATASSDRSGLPTTSRTCRACSPQRVDARTCWARPTARRWRCTPPARTVRGFGRWCCSSRPLFAAGASLHSTLERYRACLDEGALAPAARMFAAEAARVPSLLLDTLPRAEDLDTDVGRRSGVCTISRR
jgi:hypothetical protein